MAVWSYAQEDNWDRTQTRLLHLPTSEVAAMSAEILEHAAAQGQAAETLQRIARLGDCLRRDRPGHRCLCGRRAGQGIAPPVGVTHPTPTAALVGRTPTTEATATPRPRPSQTAVAGASQGASATVEAGVPLDSFTIVSQTLSCEPEPYLAVSLELSRTVEIEGGKFSNRLAYPCARSGLSGTAVPIGRSPDYGPERSGICRLHGRARSGIQPLRRQSQRSPNPHATSGAVPSLGRTRVVSRTLVLARTL